LTPMLVILAAMFILWRTLGRLEPAPVTAPLTPTPPAPTKLTTLVAYADRLYSEKKWLAAEKAYLSVLKLDHKNATAYSHLGVIYSTQKNMPDAIECFQIAARLHPSGTTLQNLALAYFDNRNLMKAIAAFQKAIMFEPTAARYIGLSRAQAKLGNMPDAITSLEASAQLDPNKRTLQLLAETLDEAGRPVAAAKAWRRLREADPTNVAASKRLDKSPKTPVKDRSTRPLK
jgi:tetratricopeptide (TPR) repeat protein